MICATRNGPDIRDGLALIWCQRSIFIALIIVVTAVYSLGFRNGFVWIDEAEIVQDGLIVRSVSDLGKLAITDNNNPLYYRPLNNIVHSVNVQLWGKSPFGFHVMQLYMHLINISLLLCIMRRSSLGSFWALGATAIWSSRPANAEAIGLISVVQNVLVLTLMLLSIRETMWAHKNRGGARRLVVGYLWFAAAIMTKETALVLPGIVLAVNFSRKVSATMHRRYIIWIIVTCATSVLWLSGRVGLIRRAVGGSVGFLERSLTFVWVYLEYIAGFLGFMESRLSDTTTIFTFFDWPIKLALAIGACIVGAGMLLLLSRRNVVSLAVIVFHLMILPVSQVIQIPHFRADRYMYIPGIALAVIVIGVAKEFASRGRAWMVLVICACVVFVGLGFKSTIDRLAIFGDDHVLFRREVEMRSDYREGLCMLARAFQRDGDYTKASLYYERCLQPEIRSVSYANEFVARINFAAVLLAQERNDEAIVVLSDPDLLADEGEMGLEARRSLAMAYFRAGAVMKAIDLLKTHVRFRPEDADAWFILGEGQRRIGDAEGSLRSFEMYLQLAPLATDAAAVRRTVLDLQRSR